MTDHPNKPDFTPYTGPLHKPHRAPRMFWARVAGPDLKHDQVAHFSDRDRAIFEVTEKHYPEVGDCWHVAFVDNSMVTLIGPEDTLLVMVPIKEKEE